MADVSPILSLRDVSKSYRTEVVTEVLHHVNLTMARGEFAALIGPSGSGKSTLLNLIGLLDRPTSGTLVIDGHDTQALDEAGLTRLRGRTIGFVFQFHHLIPALSARENVAMPMAVDKGTLDRAMRARADALLARVGLQDYGSRKPSQLSGGQQQRVAIARALALEPPLVLADEPTGNLDTHASDQMFALIREFNRTMNVAFLIVTHDPRIAERCDRVIRLIDGRVSEDVRQHAAESRPPS